MSAETNKDLNQRWIRAANERDWASEAACRTADFTAHMAGAPGPLDSDGWAELLGVFVTAFPDLQIAIESEVSDVAVVASRWTITGTHHGEFMGVPPTGRQIAMQGIDFSRVVDGKVAEHWAQFDVLGVLQQLGTIPAPA